MSINRHNQNSGAKKREAKIAHDLERTEPKASDLLIWFTNRCSRPGFFDDRFRRATELDQPGNSASCDAAPGRPLGTRAVWLAAKFAFGVCGQIAQPPRQESPL
jgi:hypothetical protein